MFEIKNLKKFSEKCFCSFLSRKAVFRVLRVTSGYFWSCGTDERFLKKTSFSVRLCTLQKKFIWSKFFGLEKAFCELGGLHFVFFDTRRRFPEETFLTFLKIRLLMFRDLVKLVFESYGYLFGYFSALQID